MLVDLRGCRSCGGGDGGGVSGGARQGIRRREMKYFQFIFELVYGEIK